MERVGWSVGKEPLSAWRRGRKPHPDDPDDDEDDDGQEG
jgi:hypothetical protein